MVSLLSRTLLVFVATAIACHAALPTTAEVAANTAQGLRLIELEEGVDPVWMTVAERFELIKASKDFFDITETYEAPEGLSLAKISRPAAAAPKPQEPIQYPTPSRHRIVNPLISQISLQNMQRNLGNLTAFHNRYYESETGVAASIWIRDTLARIARSNPRSQASVTLVKHAFAQRSIVARFPGRNDRGPLTILGAHMDSINREDNTPETSRAPGADDDGSGSVNLIEAFRVLVGGGFRPATPVEFHWYAGEELGLLGSQDIAKSYSKRGISVKGMMQLDMTAYFRPGTPEVISLISDFTDANLTNFVGSLVDAYSTLDWEINNPCGYGCSDHASWNRYGYPSAFPFEARFTENMNDQIHTVNDTIDLPGFSWNHTLEYTKLAVAYAIELAS